MRATTTWIGTGNENETAPAPTAPNHTLEYRLIYSIIFGVMLTVNSILFLIGLLSMSSKKHSGQPSLVREARSVAHSAVPFIFER